MRARDPYPLPHPSIWDFVPQALRHVALVLGVGMALATVFTAWTPGSW